MAEVRLNDSGPRGSRYLPATLTKHTLPEKGHVMAVRKSRPARGVCPVCGRPARRTYCSAACHAKMRRRWEDRQCACCGGMFHVYQADLRKGGGVYCSMACRRKHKSENGKAYPKIGRKSIHRIVAAETAGRTLNECEVVHHKDGNRKNYAPDNLEILPSQAAHMRLHAKCGEESSFAKLTWENVREIRRRRAAGESTASLAAQFGIDQSNVRLIVRGRTWKE